MSRASSVLVFGLVLGFAVGPVAGAGPARAAELVVDERAAETSVASEPAATGSARALARVPVAGPSPRSLTFIAASGYGYTESVLGSGDRHDRAMARLGVEGRATPWLGLALRFDGRYDHHSLPGGAADSGLVGDPRVQIRADRALGGGFAVGARAGVWLPGRNAPSIAWSAMTPELIGMASYASSGVSIPITLALNVGYRSDQSARTATDAAMLSASDRSALGVSAFDAVLLGASASTGRGRVRGYAEWSWDLLVGSGSPAPLTSPMILGAGVRIAASEALGVEVAAEVSPSRRPEMSATAPLVPIPPRLAGWIGLTYAIGAQRPVPAPRPPAAEVTPPAEQPPVKVAPPVVPDPAPAVAGDDDPKPSLPGGQIRGYIRSLRGRTVDAEIEVREVGREAGKSDAPAPQALHAQDGRFELDVAPGNYEVRVSAPGYESQRRHIQVEQNGVTLLNVDLRGAR
jgi:hypothetical protein